MPEDEATITTDTIRIVGITKAQAYYLKRPGRWVIVCTDDTPAPREEARKLNEALAKEKLR